MRLLLVFFAMMLSFAGISCKKTTMVTGMITDSATGQPIKGVKVLMAGNKNGSDETITVDLDISATDTLGQYAVEVSGKRIQRVFIRITKDGYAEKKIVYFDNGSCTEYNWVLNPYDAYLSIKLINQSGANDLFYAIAGNNYDGLRIVGPSGSHSLMIPKDDSLTQVVKIAGGDFNQLLWDIKNFGSSPAHIDSIFCPRNDTTYYVLRF